MKPTVSYAQIEQMEEPRGRGLLPGVGTQQSDLLESHILLFYVIVVTSVNVLWLARERKFWYSLLAFVDREVCTCATALSMWEFGLVPGRSMCACRQNGCWYLTSLLSNFKLKQEVLCVGPPNLEAGRIGAIFVR